MLAMAIMVMTTMLFRIIINLSALESLVGVDQEHSDSHRADTAGDRSYKSGFFFDIVKVNIAADMPINSSYANIDDNGAGFYPIRFYHLGLTASGDDDVSSLSDFFQVGSQRMGNGDRAIGIEQKFAHRATDYVRTSDNYSVFSGE